jgi:hypothetical protein
MVDWYLELDKKQVKELDEIINKYKDSYTDVLTSLVWLLKNRNYRLNEIPDIEKEIENRLNILKIVEESKVKTKVSFKLIPNFTSDFETKLSKKLAVAVIMRSMIVLGWIVTNVEDDTIEAKRPNYWGVISEEIIILITNNLIKITSKSFKNIICDFGNNSKRTEEFKIVYNIIQAEYRSGHSKKNI